MKRVRVDFVVREIDIDGGPEQARGVSFGEDIDVDELYEFFNRCRDGANLIFSGKRPKDEVKVIIGPQGPPGPQGPAYQTSTSIDPLAAIAKSVAKTFTETDDEHKRRLHKLKNFF